MPQFLPNSSPKKLTLRESWKVYKFLDGVGINLSGDDVSDTFSLVDNLSPIHFNTLLGMFCEKVETKSPIQIAGLLLQGMTKNNIVSFIKFIRNISHAPTDS